MFGIGKRRLGRDGPEVSAIGLGCMGMSEFYVGGSEKESIATIHHALDRGVTFLDTADMYGWGANEELVGRAIAGRRDEVFLATKFGNVRGPNGEFLGVRGDPEYVRSAGEASLRRLNVETIDLYYHHKDDPNVPLADSLGAMDALVKAGKVRAIGLSQYSPERLAEAMRTAADEGLARPCALQTWYNLVEREKLEGPLLDTALANGLGVIPFYGLANGFLTGKYRSREDLGKSTRGERVAAYLEGKGRRVLDALDEVHAEIGAPLAAIALAWTNAQPGIAATLASATGVAQLEQLVAAMNLELSPDQIERLDKASAEEEPATA